MRALVSALLILCAVCASVHASWLTYHPAEAQDRRVAMSVVEDLADRRERGFVPLLVDREESRHPGLERLAR